MERNEIHLTSKHLLRRLQARHEMDPEEEAAPQAAPEPVEPSPAGPWPSDPGAGQVPAATLDEQEAAPAPLTMGREWRRGKAEPLALAPSPAAPSEEALRLMVWAATEAARVTRRESDSAEVGVFLLSLPELGAAQAESEPIPESSTEAAGTPRRFALPDKRVQWALLIGVSLLILFWLLIA